jgi:hypothetical protein
MYAELNCEVAEPSVVLSGRELVTPLAALLRIDWATVSRQVWIARLRKSAPLSQRMVEVLYFAAVRRKKSKYFQRALVSVVTGDADHSPITRGTSVKLPRTAAMSASRLALSAEEPHVVLPQALKMKSSRSYQHFSLPQLKLKSDLQGE